MVFSVMIVTHISYNRIADLMCTVVESPIGDWLRSVKPITPDAVFLKANDIRNWYADEGFYDVHGFKFEATVEDPSGDGTKNKKVVVDRQRIEEALTRMSEVHSDHFNDFVKENDDAITADIFFQLVCYGGIVYG